MTKIGLDKTVIVIGTGKSFLIEGKEYSVHPTVAERLIASGKAAKPAKTDKAVK